MKGGSEHNCSIRVMGVKGVSVYGKRGKSILVGPLNILIYTCVRGRGENWVVYRRGEERIPVCEVMIVL